MTTRTPNGSCPSNLDGQLSARSETHGRRHRPCHCPSSCPSLHRNRVCRTRAVDDAVAFEARVATIQQDWRAAAGTVRRGSAADLLIGALPGAPVVSVSSAADIIGRSFQATNEAMARLDAAGVVRQVNVGRRNRAFEAPATIDADERHPIGAARPASTSADQPLENSDYIGATSRIPHEEVGHGASDPPLRRDPSRATEGRRSSVTARDGTAGRCRWPGRRRS